MLAVVQPAIDPTGLDIAIADFFHLLCGQQLEQPLHHLPQTHPVSLLVLVHVRYLARFFAGAGVL